MRVNYRFYAIIALVAVFGLYALLLSANFEMGLWGCLNSADLGIYHQALVEIAYGADWNPFLTVRGVRVFNDHFDPVVFLGAGLLKLFGPYLEVSILWEGLAPIFAIAALWWARRPGSWLEFLLISSGIIFAKGLLNAFEYPLHASFWSLPMWALFVAAWWRRDFTRMIVWGIVLCLFRESYPYVLLTFGPYLYFFEKERKAGLLTFAAGVLMTLAAFPGRKWLVGPLWGHGISLLTPLMENPFGYALDVIRTLPVHEIVHLFLPLFVMSFLVHWGNDRRRILLGVGAMLAPLFLIQVLFASFGKHYGFPFYIAPLAALYVSGVFSRTAQSPRRSWSTFFVLFIGAAGHLGSAYSTVVHHRREYCDLSTAKKESQREALNLLKDVAPEMKIAATGGIVPVLIKPGGQLLHAHYLSFEQEAYDYLVFERNGSGKTWPVTTEEVESMIERCRPLASEILVEDAFLFVAKGRFPYACVDIPRLRERYGALRNGGENRIHGRFGHQ